MAEGLQRSSGGEGTEPWDTWKLPRQEARSSWETQSEVRSSRETGCSIVDCRIPGISLLTVQEQDEQRQPTVAKLIEKFESHKYKEQFLEDMSQTQKINRFSEAWQRLLKDINQTEIFELCENTRSCSAWTANPLQKLGSFIADADEI